MRKLLGLAGAVMLLPGPLLAQVSENVSAGDPESIAKLLEMTGFEPELGKDDDGDPKISITTSGYRTTIFFLRLC